MSGEYTHRTTEELCAMLKRSISIHGHAVEYHALSDLITERDEALKALADIVATLKRDAPGTPLNDRKYDALGARANAILTKAGLA